MKCPYCIQEDIKSRVFYSRQPKMVTLECKFNMSYWDEDGKYHNHNHEETDYECSNKHEFTIIDHCEFGDCCD